MKLRCLSLVAITVTICLLAPMVPAKAVTVRMPYEGPSVGTYQGLSDCDDPVRSMGTVCAAIPRQADRIDLAVVDSSGLKVGGVYYIHDAAGAEIGSGVFCGAGTLPVPQGGGTIAVRLDAFNGPAACIEAGASATGPATKGVVALRLR